MPETSSLLLAGQESAWKRILTHPFVTRTSAGTLPRARFDRWLTEDYFFVLAFRAFLRELSTIAPDDAAREVLAGGLAALEPELALFEAEAAERGLDLAVEPSLLNLGYSSYLLASVHAGWPVGITVLYAVEKAYYDAWASVRDTTGPDTPYAGFVANWSSPEFAAYVEQLAGLVDREQPAAELTLAFDRVVRFELAFWDLVQG
ncbi:thiaminase/transcriptional activator TenA [Kribbella amoyensis]|uniref:Thiaminase/transcriptional activator TenA n=1 Tax=Kribbella amoyensis TaxID=996641 RepID=A0A561BML1_9ACTN|nr:transcriptional regulator [Kribbella amoyensis]TWD80089.1 thiaminase/transcriptional activator TenA [Kribbella amoyensis]